MRIALISDIHANELALRAVLDDIRIRGKHDEFLLNPALAETYTTIPSILTSIDWCRKQLTADDLNFIRTFRPFHQIQLGPDSNAEPARCPS